MGAPILGACPPPGQCFTVDFGATTGVEQPGGCHVNTLTKHRRVGPVRIGTGWSSSTRLKATLTVAMTVAATIGIAVPAAADDGASEAAAIESAVTRVAPTEISADVVELPNGEVSGNGVSADLVAPARGDGLVTVTGESGVTVSFGLPHEADGALAEVTERGSVVYADPDGLTDVVVQPLEDGVRIQTVINSAQAPSTYDYRLDPGITPVINGDGSVDLVYAAEGLSIGVGHIDTPWAVDAHGVSVPTHFIVSAGDLTQVVEHGAAGVAYPVVADPKYQGNCGIITCTARFDRATTKDIAKGANLAGIALGVASYFGGVAVLVLAGVLAAQAVYADDYYGNGNCYGIKRLKASGLFTPTQVTCGTYNCR